MIDPKNKIDDTVEAKVARGSLFSRDIKGLKIAAPEIEKLLGESLENMGQQLGTQFSASSEEAAVNYSLKLSDYSCAAADSRLSCDMSAVLHFEVARQ